MRKQYLLHSEMAWTSSYSSDSQPELFCFPEGYLQCLETFLIVTTGRGLLMTSARLRPGLLLKNLQCTGHPNTALMLRLRNPGLRDAGETNPCFNKQKIFISFWNRLEGGRCLVKTRKNFLIIRQLVMHMSQCRASSLSWGFKHG